jgi:hypothetical protein
MTNSNMGICFGVSLLSSNNLMINNNNNNSASSNSLNLSQSDTNSTTTTTTTITNNNSNNKTIDMATATNVFDFLLTNNDRLFPIEMQFLIPNLISKPSINRLHNNNNNNATLSKGSSLSNFQQIEPPTIVQRKTLTNTPNYNSQINEVNSSEVPRFIIETAANDLINRNNNNNNTNSYSTPISQSSSQNLTSITNINRHIKKSSYDSSNNRQIEDDKYSSNNSINSMNNKSPFNQE